MVKAWDCINNTSFSSQLMNGPDKLECLFLAFPFYSNVCGQGQEPTLEWST
jgi:hypothetical protein